MDPVNTDLTITSVGKMGASPKGLFTPGSKSQRFTIGGVENDKKPVKDFAIKYLEITKKKPENFSGKDSTLTRGGALWLSAQDKKGTKLWVRVNRHDLCARLGIDQKELERAEVKGFETQNTLVQGKVGELQKTYTEAAALNMRVAAAPKSPEGIKKRPSSEEIFTVISHLKGLKLDIQETLNKIDPSDDRQEILRLRSNLEVINDAINGYTKIIDKDDFLLLSGVELLSRDSDASLKEEGIFRKSGQGDIMKEVSEGKIDLYDAGVDKFTQAVVVKQAIGRKYAVPLGKRVILYALEEKLKDPDKKQEIIGDLRGIFSPPNNYQVLSDVMNMLSRTVSYNESNKMTTSNLGIVIGPQLFDRFNNENSMNQLNQSTFQSNLATFIIENANAIFSDESAAGA
jgi:RhoGAP domain